MHDRLVRLGRNHFRDEPPMAGHMIALEAQQAGAPAARQLFRLRQLGLRLVRAHMLAEYRLHPFRMPGANRIAPGLRRPQRLQMHICDALCVQPGGKLSLGEAGFARPWHGAHIDQQRNARSAQLGQHLIDDAALIADGEQVRHAQRGTTGCTPPGGTKPLARMQRNTAWRWDS